MSATSSTPVMAGPARWFDGQRAEGQAVRVSVHGQALHIARDGDGAGAVQSVNLQALPPAERWCNGVLALPLPDGSTLWLDGQSGDVAAALLASAGRRGSVKRLIDRWPAVLACLMALVALVTWFDRQGAGLAAQAALHVVPRSVDQVVGARALETLDAQWLKPSQGNSERQHAVTERFLAQAAAQAPGQTVKVEFRHTRDGPGFNALAFPHGTLVVLDGLFDALSDDELMALLGHELGHLVHRHGMQSVVRSFGLISVAGVVLGDFSTVAAASLGSVQALRYGRDAEREADAYANAFLQQAGLPAEVEASMWRKLLDRERERGTAGSPAWLSTHPPTEERLRRAESR